MAELAGLLLAVAGVTDIVVRTTVTITDLLRDWKDAPTQIHSLGDEIRSSRQVALRLLELCQSLDVKSEAFYIAAIGDQIRKAEPYWSKMEDILKGVNNSSGSLRKAKWLKSAHRVLGLQKRLRELRVMTLEIISVYNASRTIRVESLVTTHHNVQQAWSESTSRALSDILLAIRSAQIPKDQGKNNTLDATIPIEKDSSHSNSMLVMTRQVDGVRAQCTSQCQCKCHSGQRHGRLRINPLYGYLGVLSVAYIGWDFAGPRCNDSCCQKARFKVLEISYSTSLLPKSVSVIASLKLTDGEPMIGLTIGRTVNITDEADHTATVSLTKTGAISELKIKLERRPDAVLDVNYMNGFSALHNAALQGSVDMVKILLAAGADPFLEDYWGVPAIFECYQRLLRGTDSIDEKDNLTNSLPLSSFFEEYSFSHIQKVVLNIRPLSLQMELDKVIFQQQLDLQDGMGMTPLHWAAINRDVSAVRMLLQAGAHPNIQDKRGRTPLYEACASNSEACARELLAYGADVDSSYKLGYRPIHAAAVGGGSCNLLKLLLSAGADINDRRNVWKAAPLTRAVGYNNLSCCQHLLDLGADIDAEEDDGEIPLFTAARIGTNHCLELLLSRGANYLHKTTAGPAGKTLLHQAARTGGLETFEILTATDLGGLDPDAKDGDSMTARQYLASRPGVSLEMIKCFENLLQVVRRRNDELSKMYDGDEDQFFDALESLDA